MRDETDTSAELFRGEILWDYVRMGDGGDDWLSFRHLLAFFLLRVNTGWFLGLATSHVTISTRRAG